MKRLLLILMLLFSLFIPHVNSATTFGAVNSTSEVANHWCIVSVNINRGTPNANDRWWYSTNITGTPVNSSEQSFTSNPEVVRHVFTLPDDLGYPLGIIFYSNETTTSTVYASSLELIITRASRSIIVLGYFLVGILGYILSRKYYGRSKEVVGAIYGCILTLILILIYDYGLITDSDLFGLGIYVVLFLHILMYIVVIMGGSV